MELDIDIVINNRKNKKKLNFFFISKLTTTLYLIILLPIFLALIGILFLDQYKKTLVSHEMLGLRRQADTLAIMINRLERDSDLVVRRSLSLDSAELLLPLAGGENEVRIRLFQPNGTLLADTQALSQFSPKVEVFRLPKLEKSSNFFKFFKNIKNEIGSFFQGTDNYPIYNENVNTTAIQFIEVITALNGLNKSMVRKDQNGKLILSVAVPVGNQRKVRGALMLTVDGQRIQEEIKQLQYSFFKIFTIVFIFTLLLGYIFSQRITSPIIRLAKSADTIRNSRNKTNLGVTSFFNRKDEIGELAHSLDEMTKDLWRRMDSIESFAADVSHELKNPLTSLKSAIETISKLKDPSKQTRLMEVILNDVERLDRLITDISSASRLDAELSRDEIKKININKLILGFINIRKETLKNVKFKLNLSEEVFINGNETRLVQVFDNLLANAISFSPKNSSIVINTEINKEKILISIIDEGPGVSIGKTKTIFERFYSERPVKEEFGKHSGLGLSIVNQIITAHEGEIYCENIIDKNQNIKGAKFIISFYILR